MTGKRLPNDMPNEQWGRGGMEMKRRWGLALCHEHLSRHLGEAKPGKFQTGGFPTFFGKGPDCVADPFRTVPRRCC